MKAFRFAGLLIVCVTLARSAPGAGKVDLTSPDPVIRALSASALGEGGDRASVRELTPLLDDPIDFVVLAALVALGDIGDSSARPAIEKKLADRNFAIKAAAMSQLGRIGDHSAAAKLEQIYRDPGGSNPHEQELIRIIAVRTLILCPDPEVVDSLIASEMSNPDTSDAVKESLAAAAGATGDEKHIPLLKRILQEEPIRPMCGAAVGLALLGDNSGIPKMIERLPTIRDYNEARPVRDTLKRLTGERIWHPKQWRQWWEKNQKTFRAKRPEK